MVPTKKAKKASGKGDDTLTRLVPTTHPFLCFILTDFFFFLLRLTPIMMPAAEAAVSVAKGGTSITTRATALKQSADQVSKNSKASGSQSDKTTSRKQPKNSSGALITKVTTPATQTKRKGTPAQNIENIRDHPSVPSANLHTVQGSTLQTVNNKAVTADIKKSPDNKNTDVGDSSSHGSETIRVLNSDQGKQSKGSPSNTRENDPTKSRKLFLPIPCFFLLLFLIAIFIVFFISPFFFFFLQSRETGTQIKGLTV